MWADQRPLPPLPPVNEAAEQALLGAILINNAAMDRDAVGLLEEGHFAFAVHGRIFAAARSLIERRQVADPITLLTYFEREDGLAEVGGPKYLAILASAAVSIINAEHYAAAVRDAAVRRGLMAAASDIAEAAGAPHAATTTEELLAWSEGRVAAVSDGVAPGEGMATLGAALQGALQMAEAAWKADGRITGLTTGLADLDRALGGLHPSNLVVLAGRPSQGKTALATGIALAVARAEADLVRTAERAGADAPRPGSVAFFSLEMSGQELGQRMLAEMTGVSVDRVRNGRIGQMDFHMMQNAKEELEHLPLCIDDTPAASVGQIRLRARRLARGRQLRLVVVDYLQLIMGRGRAENRTQEVSEITRGLKMLAKELAVPVLALSQLSRQVESREDKRPGLADLRESGSIEQDADIVLFVYRDELYVAQREPKRSEKDTESGHMDRMTRWTQAMEAARGIAEVIVAKQRHGPTRTVRLRFDGERARFENLARDQ